jgi:MtrB/PioB family decaheme-associated outer membrane protein
MLLPVMTGLAGAAAAQTPAGPPSGRGSVDFGLRLTDVSGDAARYQRFRDLGDGGFLDRAWIERRGSNWNLQAAAGKVGRRDQWYWGEYKHSGRLKVTLFYDEIPLLMSDDTRTLYTIGSPGVLSVSDTVQAAAQTSAASLSGAVAGLQSFRLQSRRRIGRLDLVFRPTREIDVKFSLVNTTREGTMPYGASFGFSSAAEVSAPIDTRTTDLVAGVEWVKSNRSLRVSYNGSWFDNHVPSLVWDNPWRAVDSATAGSSQGRMALWPDSTLQAVTAAGWLKMAGRTHLNGSVTIGTGSQNEALLPFTINPQIAPLPLSRATAEAEVRNVAVNLGLTSRPNSKVWLSARLRYYDSENRMPAFHDASYVRMDQLVRTLHGEPTAPFSFTRQNVDLDASFTPRPFAALRVGYSRDTTDRDGRIFAQTVDDVFRASVDTSAKGWLTIRGIVEHAVRTGSGFRAALLPEIGEQPAVRQYDISDRNRDRVTGLVQITPISAVGFSVSASRGKDTYNNKESGEAGFGLRDNENRLMTVSLDLLPSEKVSAGVWYSYETFDTLQRSRQSTAALFTDSRRDWTLDSNETVRTLSLNLDLLKIRDRADVRLGYDSSRSRATYIHGVVPGSTLAAPIALPPVRNIVDTARAEFGWALTGRLGVSLIYRFDQYRVDDYAMGPGTITRLNMPGSLFLGYLYRPYKANGAWLRMSYRWD